MKIVTECAADLPAGKLNSLEIQKKEILRISLVLGVHIGPGIVGAAAVPIELHEEFIEKNRPPARSSREVAPARAIRFPDHFPVETRGRPSPPVNHSSRRRCAHWASLPECTG